MGTDPFDCDRATFVAGDLAAVIRRHLAAPPSPWCLRVVEADGTRTVTWPDIATLATELGARCAALGAVPGDVIAIGWRHGPEAIGAWAGAVLGGFVPTFVADADPSLSRVGTNAGRSIAIVQRTSGTTGPHRTVAIDHRRVLAQIWGLAHALRLDTADIIASCLPLHHDMGLVSTVLLPLACGVPCVHVDPELWRADATVLLRAVAEVRATLTWLPPSALARLVRRAEQTSVDLSSLRQIVCGGEVVPDSTLREFAAGFAAAGVSPDVLGTGWGMAENVAAVTHSPPGRAPTRLRIAWSSFAPGGRIAMAGDIDDALTLVSVGPSIEGTRVAVRDDDGHDVDDGVLGVLHIGGDCHADPSGWHPTGDIGIVHGGEVFVCGRRDDLIHADGRWIPPHEAELVAGAMPGVRPGRVAAIAGAGGELVVLVEIGDATTLAADAIADAVEHRVRRRPRVVAVAPGSLPKSSSGKLARRRCAALVHDE